MDCAKPIGQNLSCTWCHRYHLRYFRKTLKTSKTWTELYPHREVTHEKFGVRTLGKSRASFVAAKSLDEWMAPSSMRVLDARVQVPAGVKIVVVYTTCPKEAGL
jgi:hypothetical protein